MKCQVILLVALISTAVLLDSSEAWRIRIRLRRIWRAIAKPFCRWTLSKICTYYIGHGTICKWGSRKICGKRRRRDLVEETLNKDERLIPLPALFETYDLDGDEKITAKELAQATGMDELDTLNEAFPVCDINNDGFIDHKEFVNSPLIVEDVEDIEMEHKEVAEEMEGDSEEKSSAVNEEGSGDSEEVGESTENKSKAENSPPAE